jgi:hypothetical protein
MNHLNLKIRTAPNENISKDIWMNKFLLQSIQVKAWTAVFLKLKAQQKSIQLSKA